MFLSLLSMAWIASNYTLAYLATIFDDWTFGDYFKCCLYNCVPVAQWYNTRLIIPRSRGWLPPLVPWERKCQKVVFTQAKSFQYNFHLSDSGSTFCNLPNKIVFMSYLWLCIASNNNLAIWQLFLKIQLFSFWRLLFYVLPTQLCSRSTVV